LVTKNAWKTPPGARPNRDGIVFRNKNKKLSFISHQGWLLELRGDF